MITIIKKVIKWCSDKIIKFSVVRLFMRENWEERADKEQTSIKRTGRRKKKKSKNKNQQNVPIEQVIISISSLTRKSWGCGNEAICKWKKSTEWTTLIIIWILNFGSFSSQPSTTNFWAFNLVQTLISEFRAKNRITKINSFIKLFWPSIINKHNQDKFFMII